MELRMVFSRKIRIDGVHGTQTQQNDFGRSWY